MQTLEKYDIEVAIKVDEKDIYVEDEGFDLW